MYIVHSHGSPLPAKDLETSWLRNAEDRFTSKPKGGNEWALIYILYGVYININRYTSNGGYTLNGIQYLFYGVYFLAENHQNNPQHVASSLIFPKMSTKLQWIKDSG